MKNFPIIRYNLPWFKNWPRPAAAYSSMERHAGKDKEEAGKTKRLLCVLDVLKFSWNDNTVVEFFG